MKYRVKFKAGFEDKSFCYFCFPPKNKSAVLYEVNMTGYEKTTDNYSIERQGYYNYLLNFTLSGQGKMVYNGREYLLRKGDLLFINCAERHMFESVKGTKWEYVYVHVSGLGMEYFYKDFLDVTGNVFRSFDGRTFCANISKLHEMLSAFPMQRVENSFHIDLTEEACCDAARLVYAAITDIVRQVSAVPVDRPYSLSAAIDYINENFNRKLSLEEIARQAYLSKFHFERAFFACTGKTVHGYVTELRLNRAMWLLETTKKRLADIAVEVGFSDSQALTKIFKKNLGVTPAAFRKTKYHYYDE